MAWHKVFTVEISKNQWQFDEITAGKLYFRLCELLADSGLEPVKNCMSYIATLKVFGDLEDEEVGRRYFAASLYAIVRVLQAD